MDRSHGIHENPYNAQLYFSLGLAYGAAGSFQKAQAALEKTLMLDPNYPRERYNLEIILNKIIKNEAGFPSA